jgi:hypothetical protein
MSSRGRFEGLWRVYSEREGERAIESGGNLKARNKTDTERTGRTRQRVDLEVFGDPELTFGYGGP